MTYQQVKTSEWFPSNLAAFLSQDSNFRRGYCAEIMLFVRASYKERTRDQTRLGLGLGLGSLCPFFTGDPFVQAILDSLYRVADRRRCANILLAERRRRYTCGYSYVTLDRIPSWAENLKEGRVNPAIAGK